MTEGHCNLTSSNEYIEDAMDLKVLSGTIRNNYSLLGLALLFTLLTIAVIIYVVYQIIDSIQVYYRFYVRANEAKYSQMNDNQSYDTDYSQPEKKDEYSAIESKIADLESRYKSFNSEMGMYTRDVLNREPDDLIDQKILARRYDNYTYSN